MSRRRILMIAQCNQLNHLTKTRAHGRSVSSRCRLALGTASNAVRQNRRHANRRSAVQRLDNLKKAAIARGVHFVIIAGDVFDDNAVPAALAERTLSALEGSSWPGQVFLIPGNHDPLTPGCVWDRDPWKREQPHKRVRLLRTSSPVALPEFSATLFPCPLRHRTSIDDPTIWIAGHPAPPTQISGSALRTAACRSCRSCPRTII